MTEDTTFTGRHSWLALRKSLIDSFLATILTNTLWIINLLRCALKCAIWNSMTGWSWVHSSHVRLLEDTKLLILSYVMSWSFIFLLKLTNAFPCFSVYVCIIAHLVLLNNKNRRIPFLSYVTILWYCFPHLSQFVYHGLEIRVILNIELKIPMQLHYWSGCLVLSVEILIMDFKILTSPSGLILTSQYPESYSHNDQASILSALTFHIYIYIYRGYMILCKLIVRHFI